MTLAKLLPLLRERGIKVWASGRDLRFSAPKGAMTPELKSALLEHKETLLSALSAPRERIPRTPRTGALPLSFAQQRLWLLEQLEPGSAVYNIPAAVRLTGQLDVEALRRTFEELVRRHETLRTTFSLVDGEPRQTIHPSPGSQTLPLAGWRLPVITLSRQDPDALEREVARLAEEEASRPFSLETGPLLRTTLLRLDPLEHVLLLTMHHIASDGLSDAILIRELAAIYPAFRDGRPSPLPELDLQYADFAAWQRSPEQERVLAEQAEYWKARLRGAPPLELPVDRPRPPRQTTRGALVTRRLSPELSTAVRELGERREAEHATTFMTLLAALHVLLARYSGQTDISIGTPIANRTREEVEPLIGFFVNTLVIRVDLSGEPTFLDVLARVREAALGAYAHQEVPFERVVAELPSDRDLSRSPLFQVLFALQSTRGPSLSLPGLAISPVDIPTHVAKFDLSFSIEDDGEGPLGAAIEYNTDLFDARSIEALLAHFEVVLRGAVAHPEMRITELPLLTDEERARLLHARVSDAAPISAGETLVHRLFEGQVERTPDAVAIQHGDVAVTYTELNRRANRLARHLRTRGVSAEVAVGVRLPRSIDMVVTLLAILKAGGAYVPIDPEYPAERASLLIADAHLALVVTDATLVAYHDAHHDDTNLALEVDPRGAAYVIYTSGSTGAPKGVAITHESAAAFLRWARRAFGGGELQGVLAVTSLSFDLSVFEIFAPLSAGGAVLLARDALDFDALKSSARPITLLNTVPSAMREWLRAGVLPATARVVNLAGEPLTRDLASKVYEVPTVTRLVNLYGPTEDTTYSTIAEVAKDDPREPHIGVPIDGTAAYVLDARLEPVPPGVVGELWLAGDGLARGYVRRPALTADRFRPDPFASRAGTRMYRTGDLARWRRDGTLECLGRVDFQVKVRGFRIELPEIEARLREHPSVREAVVLARRGDASDDKVLVAYYVTKSEDPAASSIALTPNALREHLAARLPRYMVPSAYVRLDALPTTTNGKLDRSALPSPDLTASDTSTAHTKRDVPRDPPRDALELTLAGIWEELLGRAPIGIHESFFELGGHSLLAVRLMARLRAVLGRDLPLATLFEKSTIADLAQLLREAGRLTMGPLVAIHTQGARPPLYCVHPAGGNVLCFAPLARALGRDQPVYAFQSAALTTNDDVLPDDTVEAMATRYVSALRASNAPGPYHLLGYSVGGAIAYAMATLLRSSGEEVASLTLVDAPAPSVLERASDGDGDGDSDRDRDDLPLALEAEPSVDPQTARRLLAIMNANVRAARAYRPPRSSGMNVMLVRLAIEDASKAGAAGIDDSLGWRDVLDEASGGALAIHWVTGDHASVLRAPHVAAVAKLVCDHLSART